MKVTCFGYDCDCGCNERVTVARLPLHEQITSPTVHASGVCSRGTHRKFSLKQLLALKTWEEDGEPSAPADS
jgi:hypothetical protein